MKFCDNCKSILNSDYSTSELIFTCPKCYQIYQSTPEDTLRFELNFKIDKSSSKYEIFISNSPYDLAGHKVARSCKSCKSKKIDSKWMTLVYIGENKIPLYTCECGAKEHS